MNQRYDWAVSCVKRVANHKMLDRAAVVLRMTVALLAREAAVARAHTDDKDDVLLCTGSRRSASAARLWDCNSHWTS